MSDNNEIPEGWTEDDVRRYLKPSDKSGTFALGEEVATIDDVPEIEDDQHEAIG